MRTRLQLSQIIDTLDRGKTYIEVFKEIRDLQDMCQNLENTKLLEYIPVKIVACFEQFFRDEYLEILYNPDTKKRLKDIDLFKNVKYDLDLIDAFRDNTITIGEYLSYLVPCSKLEDINNALSKLLNIDFLHEFKVKYGDDVLRSVIEVFRLRHIYCHEAPLSDEITQENALLLAVDSYHFLEYSDDVIRTALYSDSSNLIDELSIARCNYAKANSELEELIEKIKSKTKDHPLSYSDFSYLNMWKEYREERAKCDSSVDKDNYLPLYYHRSLERTTRTLIKELKEDYKYELRR